jgi:putative spermidine/putrescine transport system ATP-binding protein
VTVPHLSLEKIRKGFGAKDVVDDVSLNVAAGEMLAILGPSGCGKSTLLRVVAGLLAADRGTVRIAGRDMNGVPTRDRGIGFVFQDYALFPKVTVRDNIAFGLRVRGVPHGDRNRKTSEMLELVGLAEEADRPVETLSGALSAGRSPSPLPCCCSTNRFRRWTSRSGNDCAARSRPCRKKSGSPR